MDAAAKKETEYWQRGPVPGIPGLLQPVAHTLLQVRAEVEQLLPEISPATLWTRPSGLASAGFHLAHMTGVLDRLFTYARGAGLSAGQLSYLSGESTDETKTVQVLAENFRLLVDYALQQLSATDPATLTEVRYVGRKKIPSTQIGLLFHAAEHLMRHTGQLLVTVRLTPGAGK